jgi:biopolymer transport protein TolR
MEIGSRGSLKSDINVTPLVDVMLVVLIIFMVVTPLMQKGVNVLLPEARNVLAVPDAESQVVTVTVKATGEIYVGGEQVTELNLNNELQKKLATNPALQMQIKADRNVDFAEVKKLVRAGRDVGFRNASLIASEIKDEDGEAGGAAESPQGN